MATTTPDEIYSPDAGQEYALTQDLLAMADSVQDALVSTRNQTTTVLRNQVYGDATGAVPAGSGQLVIKSGQVFSATTVQFGNEYFPVVSFDTAFPTACVHVSITPLTAPATSGTVNNATGVIALDTKTASSFRALVQSSPNPWYRAFSWMAVGY